MSNEELDVAYTAICKGLAQAGEANAQRFLAMLCLGLVARLDRADELLPLIESVQQRCGEAGAAP